jgi:hypothetical protein
MSTRLRYLGLLLTIGAAALGAASLEGPRLGVVFDPAAKTLRPILGIPGAAIIGQPLVLHPEMEQAAVSPQQDYALATTGEGREVVLLHLDGSPARSIHGVASAPDRVALSSLGRAAALYYSDRNRIQVLTGLPGAPKAAFELYLSAGESPSALVVSDDGHVVLTGIANTVFRITPSGEVPVLHGLRQVTSIALISVQGRTTANSSKGRPSPVHDGMGNPETEVTPSASTGGYDAIVADSGQNRIYRVRDVTGAAETQVLAGSDKGIAQPVAVAVSRDNQRVFVANAKSGATTILDLSGDAKPAKVSCACKPTGLARLTGDSVFLLTEPSARPMWVLDADAHQPRVVFVPADLPRTSDK